MIPCIIIQFANQDNFSDDIITNFACDTLEELNKKIEYHIRKFFENENTSQNTFESIGQFYQCYWREPYFEKCPLVIKYFNNNKWIEFSDKRIEEIFNNKLSNISIFELNGQYENESDWIKIIINDKLESELDDEIKSEVKNFSDIQVKIFNNTIDELPMEIINFTYNEAYYIDFVYKNNNYYIIIDANFSVRACYSDGIMSSKLSNYTIKTNFEEHYIKIETIGNIIFTYEYHVIKKTLTNYAFDFSALTYKIKESGDNVISTSKITNIKRKKSNKK
jgi:hypothetical protein